MSMTDLQLYPLPERIRSQLERADAVAARLQHLRREAPDCIALGVSDYEVLDRIVRQLSHERVSARMVRWHGREVISVAA